MPSTSSGPARRRRRTGDTVTGRAGSSTSSPRADPVVGALALDLDRADRARDLLDGAGERATAAATTASRLMSPAPARCGDVTLGVVGQRGLAEPDRRRVVLVAADEEGQQPGRAADAEHEHPGRHRVEGAGVADLAGRAQASGPGDDVVAGPALRLVDDAAARRAVGSPVPPLASAASAPGGLVGPSASRRRPRPRRRPRGPSCTGRPRRRTWHRRRQRPPRRRARGPRAGGPRCGRRSRGSRRR